MNTSLAFHVIELRKPGHHVKVIDQNENGSCKYLLCSCCEQNSTDYDQCVIRGRLCDDGYKHLISISMLLLLFTDVGAGTEYFS